MAHTVRIVNERTQEVKKFKVGFSWTLFLFSGILGLILYIRRLNIFGSIMLVLWGMYAVVPQIIQNHSEAKSFKLSLSIVSICLQIYFGIKGNELTVRNYIENGWKWAEPESTDTIYAKKKWGFV